MSTSLLNVDVRDVPFSRRGAYLAVSHLDAKRAPWPGLWLRSIRTLFQCGPLLRLDGAEPDHCTMQPDGLEVAREDGAGATWVFDDRGAARLRVNGGGWTLQGGPLVHMASPLPGGAWRLVAPAVQSTFHLLPLTGTLRVESPWNGKGCDGFTAVLEPEPGGVAELVVVECEGHEIPAYDPAWFDEIRAGARDSYAAFRTAQLSVPAPYTAAADLAAYIHWSCLVRPRGHLRRETMYMSKNWMTAVWSWDHAFNALALAGADPELAWDQFMLMFDSQQPSGCLPGLVSDREMFLAYGKPPIHGWALGLMRERLPAGYLDRDRLTAVRDVLARQAMYWIKQRDPHGTGLPVYWHGNDSGWDNATWMLRHTPVTGPDLAAYLVLQCDQIAALSRELGDDNEAPAWEARAESLLRGLVETLWDGSAFRGPTAGLPGISGSYDGDSLLPYQALVAAGRLPQSMVETMIGHLEQPDRFLTAHGLASESVSSPHYDPDGYWRGPVWAPTTMLIFDGLRKAGRHVLAQRVARCYCDMCATHGFAENFNALTGEGLRDRAYTWTASVFFLLATGLVDDGKSFDL